MRLSNPTDAPVAARLRVGFPVDAAPAVALDETPVAEAVALADGEVRLAVPAHALRSVLLVPP